jgi:sugar phosphate isomerase/epimerase
MDLAGGSSPNRENLDQKFTTMCCIYNEVAVLADERNVPVDVHPHSHAGSIIETEEEYDRLMELTDPVFIGWCPDSGHIVRGGLDLITTLEKYKSRIRNIHFKDVDSSGTWRMMGKGICDYEKTLLLLEEIDYEGWIIAEEESDEALKDQLSAVSKNRHYLKSLGY